MQAYGRKKSGTTVPGHQKCGICHPVQKNKKARARTNNKREIMEQENMSESREEMIKRWEEEGYLDPTCPGCKPWYDHIGHPVEVFEPGHKPSSCCESGKRPHCTCDSCF